RGGGVDDGDAAHDRSFLPRGQRADDQRLRKLGRRAARRRSGAARAQAQDNRSRLRTPMIAHPGWRIGRITAIALGVTLFALSAPFDGPARAEHGARTTTVGANASTATTSQFAIIPSIGIKTATRGR